jgi:hypothetical protein
MIPARFGLAIGDSRPVGQAVGRNRTFGRAVFCVSGLSNLATDRTGSARAGPIRALVGTGVGTRWEQIASSHGSCCPLVSSSESFAVQGVLDENTAYGPARATFYGTEGQRFESSRARFVSRKIMRICGGFGFRAPIVRSVARKLVSDSG